MSREEDRFIRHFVHLGHTDEQQITELYASIEDKGLVDKVLTQYGEPPTQHVQQPNLSSYKYAVPALLSINAFFSVNVTLSIPSLSKKYVGKGGGLIIVYAVSGGTFYYNDPNDLNNNSDWNGNFVSVYSNLNLIRGGVYATFSGGGIPGLGVSGGWGNWSAT
jgi:hypothetical protein